MRGKGTSAKDMPCAVGITPACAGKRGGRTVSFFLIRDHPRVCGEKARTLIAWEEPQGSPPRVRGKVSVDEVNVFHGGITPACAGKSPRKFSHPLPSRDHPRVCGEKNSDNEGSLPETGSPPRVRGKVLYELELSPLGGITPACAGKRLKRSHSIGHFSCILCLFHSVLHRASVSGGSRAGPCAPPCLPAQNAVPV